MKRHKDNPIVRLFFLLLILSLHSLGNVLFFIAIIQLIAIYTQKTPVDSLVQISQYALSHLFDILEYLTGISSIPPFPFSPWRNRYDP